MGGEGSIQQMINSLKNNKKLLRRKSRFEKEKPLTQSKRALSSQLKAKKASPELLENIRKDAKRIRKNWLIFYLIVSLLTIVSVFLGRYIYNQHLISEKKAKIKERKERYLKFKQNQLKVSLDRGAYYIEQQDWNAAVNAFVKAYNNNPDNYEIAYKLAHALNLSCIKNDYRCQDYYTFLKMLYKKYPEKQAKLDQLMSSLNKNIQNK